MTTIQGYLLAGAIFVVCIGISAAGAIFMLH
jgi:hypothetical protein